MLICDHGEEATVYITEITHGHFNPYDASLTQDQVDKKVTEDVVAFPFWKDIMSVLSDLIIADPQEAQDVAQCDEPARDWEGIEIKTLDPVTLGSLWAILTKASEAEAVGKLVDQIALLHNVSDNGPWVYEIPRQLRDALAEVSGMETEEVQPVAEAWAATDELKGWEYEEVESVLREVADLADTARLLGKDLLLWICL